MMKITREKKLNKRAFLSLTVFFSAHTLLAQNQCSCKKNIANIAVAKFGVSLANMALIYSDYEYLIFGIW